MNIEVGRDVKVDVGASANIAVLNAQGLIIGVNDAWKDFAQENGYKDGGSGLGLNYLAICQAAAADGDETARRVLEGLQDLLAGSTRAFTVEYPCHAPHEERWFQLIAMADSAGPEPHFLVMHLPITDRKQAERRMRDAQREAEQAAAAKSRFLAAAARDLRQSVQAAMLFYQLLPEGRSGGDGPDAVRTRLGQCLDSLHQTVDTLMDVSRLDAGIVKPQVEIFAVDPLLEKLWMEFAPEAEVRGIDFRRVGTSAIAETDPALLATMLRNLLANAVAYARRGKVLLGCRRDGDNLRLMVCDTGPGIDEREQALIFEEFYRGSQFGHERSKGLGLGLSVVKRLAKVLGQTVSLYSRPGRGSIFEVTVPRAGVRRPTVAFRETESSQLRGRLIAVIDDDADVLNQLRMYYQFLGRDVVAAQSGASAILQLRKQHRVPDAIVANSRANGAGDDGSESIRQIRSAFGRHIPGILLTGPADACRQHGECGDVHLLHKPAGLRDLALALDDILQD